MSKKARKARRKTRAERPHAEKTTNVLGNVSSSHTCVWIDTSQTPAVVTSWYRCYDIPIWLPFNRPDHDCTGRNFIYSRLYGEPANSVVYKNCGHSAACGQCFRGLLCVSGVYPSALCPRCRRTNDDHEKLRHDVLHYHKEVGTDPSVIEALLITASNAMNADAYRVPVSCPLFLRAGFGRLEGFVNEPCPVCAKTPITRRVFTSSRHKRVVIFKQKCHSDPAPSPYFDPRARGTHGKKFQCSMRRPTKGPYLRDLQK